MRLPQKFYFWISRACIVVVFAVSLVGGRISAQNVSTSPSSGIAGSTAVASVSGFLPTDPGPPPYPHATVSIGGSYIGECPGNQACDLSFIVPPYPGKQWVVANGLDHGVGVSVSNIFTVLAPSMMLNTTCGTNFSRVIVTGHQYARNDFISVGVDGGLAVNALADTNGDFAVAFILNVSGSGPHTVTAAGSGALVATNIFEVTAGSNDACAQVGRVEDVTGHPTITPAGGQPQPLHKGDPIHYGDTVNTGTGGKVDMLGLDDTQFTMSQNAHLTIDKYIFDPADTANNAAGYSALEGAFSYVSGLIGKKTDPDVSIHGTYGNIGIRGTEFISRRDPCSVTQEVYLIHGQLAITPQATGVTNIVDAPATIFFTPSNVITSGLTQSAYDALKDEINQTNPVMFASWQVQYFGCTNGNAAAAANADPDGDGQNNFAEFQAHTDPTSAASVFKLIGAAREGDGLRLTWKTHGGITNLVQAAWGLSGSFADITSNLLIPGEVDVTTNYFDAGVITNAPARFYRIRLGP